ncbi:MAG: bifunctional folylpolyglutamate synthase/dihydrofolate synthase, partial [Acidobacteriota bacterium]
MKFGLESIRRLLEELGNPHERFPSALIAGTNGKGSVSRFLSTVTSAAGLRTGLYTSPHLIRIQERIKVDGQEISEERFARHFTRVYDVIQSGRLPAHPTFFECVTATAFSFFAEKDVDFAVLEIGMGGRLDSTNVVSPLLSVITPISYDHQQYLGDTLAAIAREKAGIMRKGSPVLLAEQEPEAEQTLRAEAERIAAIPHTLDAEGLRILGHDLGRYQFAFHEETFQLRVPGIAQVQNAALAL